MSNVVEARSARKCTIQPTEDRANSVYQNARIGSAIHFFERILRRSEEARADKGSHSKQHWFATTVGDWGTSLFANHARRIPVPPDLDKLPLGSFSLCDELRLFIRVVHAALHEDLLLLYSSRGYMKPELLAVILMRLIPKSYRPKVLFYGEMYEPSRGLRRLVERIFVRLADPSVLHYVVQSVAEIPVFAQNWGVAQGKIRASGSFLRTAKLDGATSLGRQRLAKTEGSAKTGGDYIFAGGSSFRDYDALLGAVRLLPHRNFVICTNALKDPANLPPNVRTGSLSPEEYIDKIKNAAVVVVPLRVDLRRIAGTFTYLQSMWLHKPTIVSRALGVEEYVEDGKTGLLVDGSPQSYAIAIEWMLDPTNSNTIEAMCDAAHHVIRTRFTPEQHAAKLLAIVGEAVRKQN
ncbi:glycosyltransferase [Chloroflexi bacterium TSY]|nr:glycosyltransferase [Chloroflexi bacterium TSY]